MEATFMATVTLSKQTFEETISKSGILLIDWWASWCGPCRAFAPIYERIAEKYPEAVFAKIDVDAEPDLAAAFEIRSIPTLMLLRDSVLLFNRPGMLPERALEELVTKASELDMDAIRKEIGEREKAKRATGVTDV
jgi:thioredoxin